MLRTGVNSLAPYCLLILFPVKSFVFHENLIVVEALMVAVLPGMNQAGLAECIVRSVNSCHPLLHPVLYERLLLNFCKIIISSYIYISAFYEHGF